MLKRIGLILGVKAFLKTKRSTREYNLKRVRTQNLLMEKLENIFVHKFCQTEKCKTVLRHKTRNPKSIKNVFQTQHKSRGL